MTVTAKMVKDLRQQTGAGMMDCKNALTEADGDMELANDILRKKGMKIADKKSGRDANEGLVGVRVTDNVAYVVEVNCETDFVARTEGFQNFVTGVLDNFGDKIDTTEIIATLGENIKVSNLSMVPMDTVLASYIHNQVVDGMGKIGVVVSLSGTASDELAALGTQIAMHIAASNPKAVSFGDLDPEFVEKERQIFTEQALESGKPAHIAEKIVEGRMKKMLSEVALLHQPFVVNPDKTVGEILEEAEATVVTFVRTEVGE